MADLITPDLVDLDLAATERGEATRSLAERLQAAGRVTDLDQFLADVRAREAQMPTGLEGGIGIPHCRSTAVVEPTLGFGRSTQGIDWGAAAASLPGSRMPTPADLDRDAVTIADRIDPDRPLKERS